MTQPVQAQFISIHQVERESRCWLRYGFNGRWTPAQSQQQLESRLREQLKWRGKVASLHQIHSTRVVRLSGAHGLDADGWILDEAGTLAIIRVADCIPVILYHTPSQQAALLHAGRQGIAQGILSEAVRLCTAGGARPSEMHLRLGPGVGACCYQVPRSMADDFQRQTGNPHSQRPQTPSHSLLDLKGTLCYQARRLGLAGENVHPDSPCTLCQQHQFYSHRGGDTQLRQYAFAWIDA